MDIPLESTYSPARKIRTNDFTTHVRMSDPPDIMNDVTPKAVKSSPWKWTVYVEMLLLGEVGRGRLALIF